MGAELGRSASTARRREKVRELKVHGRSGNSHREYV